MARKSRATRERSLFSMGDCKCARCVGCGGSGTVWRDIGGKFLGDHRCDDLDSPEMCESCGGSGITDVCDNCRNEEEKSLAEN